MEDRFLYAFWLALTALFVFSTVYAWFIAIIVRRALPGELAWVFVGMAFITGSYAFVRSGEQVVDPAIVMAVVRAAFVAVAISSCVAVVMLGIQYNGAVSNRLPLRDQLGMLTRAFQPKREESDDEPQA